MKLEKKISPSRRMLRSRNSSLVWAWSIEPGPRHMEGIPAAARWAASENQGAPVVLVRGSVARSFWTKGFDGSVSMGGFSWAFEISRGRPSEATVSWMIFRLPPAASSEGVWRMSMLADAKFGTMFGAVPPVMVPMLRVEVPRMGWVNFSSAGARFS